MRVEATVAAEARLAATAAHAEPLSVVALKAESKAEQKVEDTLVTQVEVLRRAVARYATRGAEDEKGLVAAFSSAR